MRSTDRNHYLFFRSLTSGCQTSTRTINSCRRTAAVLCTLRLRLWTAGRTEVRRWTAGLWASCCTPWFTEPCLSTDKTTRSWFSRSALETTANPPNHLVRLLNSIEDDRDSRETSFVHRLPYFWTKAWNWFTVFVEAPAIQYISFIDGAYLFLADNVMNYVPSICWPLQGSLINLRSDCWVGNFIAGGCLDVCPISHMVFHASFLATSLRYSTGKLPRVTWTNLATQSFPALDTFLDVSLIRWSLY